MDRLAKNFRHEISLIKNGVATCFGLDGAAAVAKYNASTAALVNRLDTDNELAKQADISIAQAYDMYEAKLKQNRYSATSMRKNQHRCACSLTSRSCARPMTVCASSKACS